MENKKKIPFEETNACVLNYDRNKYFGTILNFHIGKEYFQFGQSFKTIFHFILYNFMIMRAI